MDKKENIENSSVTGPSNSISDDTTFKSKQKCRGKKRKRHCSSNSEDDYILPDNTLETERNLQASAAKNNLDDNSVKKILKKVVTNDHVLALVKLREEEERDSMLQDKSVQPKLTRSKAKELKKVSPCSGPWNLENLELIPINHIPVKTRPEVKALIAQELPEDEDDEEYEPTHDDVPSDDDHDNSCSDLDSQPRTPVTPASQHTPSPKVLKDGPFKVPQDVSSARRKLNVNEEEATIALRTRSKLSLSTTTIEHIESSFVPPDDVRPPVDNLWSQFLSDCLDPAATHEEDDEADPEYNAAADADAMDEDEDFLGSSLIKISKKELNDLVTELFNVMPATDEDLTLENLANSVLTDTSQTEVPRWEGKTEPISDDEGAIKPSKRLTFEKGNGITRFSPGKSEPEDERTHVTNHVPCEIVETRSSVKARENNEQGMETEKDNTTHGSASTRSTPDALQICIEERNPSPGPDVQRFPPYLRSKLEPETQTMHIEVQANVVFTQEQVLILQQQLRMHIQLSASNFLQLYVHPVHWRHGPTYKDYLETLEKLLEANENSVVNVCNLKPALELVRNWEKSVSKDTAENREMVQFVNDQVERSRRRFAQNCLHFGDFHENLKALVANSSVFLYPYLLPATPYKADNVKRTLYFRSEDELIVLGLDQFWRYMDENQSIFKRPRVPNRRHRWGLATALQLVCKHMLPWMTPKQLAAHVTNARAHADKHNPIYNYFTNNEIPLVQHTIVPFNPDLTLYDQPEHEMPRLWVRYLAKTCKRFKNFLSRRHHLTGAIPTGVPIKGVTPEATVKKPLPHDFTKEIKCTRNPEDPLTAKNDATNTNEKPIEEAPLNMYRLVSTSKGSFLVPLDDIVTVSGNTATVTKPSEREVLAVKSKLTFSTDTVTTPAEITSKLAPPIPQPYPIRKDTDHCTCCNLLRKIAKKQTVITDFFSKGKGSRKCYCSEVKYPKVTNKLRLLANNFKNHSGLVFKELERKLEEIKSGKVSNKTGGLGKYTLDELISVTTFQLKIVSRSLMSKFSYLKVRCKNLLTQFNPDSGDPLRLANSLFKTCGTEMIDLYLDFLEFLTAEQVDKLDKFKDYFVRNCAKNLMDKVEDQVKDEAARARILSQLKHVFSDNISTSCQICSYLLESMAGYDTLAEYTFALFPHRKPARIPAAQITSQVTPVAHIKIMNPEDQSDDSESEEEAGNADNEDGNTSGSEESSNYATMSAPSDERSTHENSESISTEIKIEPDITMDIDDSQIASAASPVTHSYMITLEEELIKEEPSEWKREEDKLILEVLQKQLTPEERKDNIPKMLDERNVINLIAESISHKSQEEVKKRVLYILSLLVLSET